MNLRSGLSQLVRDWHATPELKWSVCGFQSRLWADCFQTLASPLHDRDSCTHRTVSLTLISRHRRRKKAHAVAHLHPHFSFDWMRPIRATRRHGRCGPCPFSAISCYQGPSCCEKPCVHSDMRVSHKERRPLPLIAFIAIVPQEIPFGLVLVGIRKFVCLKFRARGAQVITFTWVLGLDKD